MDSTEPSGRRTSGCGMGCVEYSRGPVSVLAEPDRPFLSALLSGYGKNMVYTILSRLAKEVS